MYILTSSIEVSYAAYAQTDGDADTGVSLEPCVNEMATIRGSALYRIASYLNHSCDPNVAALYPHLGGHVTAFVASKPIKKDDELFYR